MLATTGSQQAGVAWLPPSPSYIHHAGIWNGTPQSWKDIHPAGAFWSIAYDTSGAHQVGVTYPGDGTTRAAFWSGTPESYVDLHQFLPLRYSESLAYDIFESNGVIYVAGYAHHGALDRNEGVLWVNALLDCNKNGIDDSCDISCGATSGPCDVPACGTSADCNANGIPDECDIADCTGDPTCTDCNSDGRPDECGVVDACEVGKLIAEQPTIGADFGFAVAVDADTLAISAPRGPSAGCPDCGTVTMFGRVGEAWNILQTIAAENVSGFSDFGRSVAMSGDVVVVGAPLEHAAGTRSGVAYVYRRANDSWVFEGELLGTDTSPGDEFGNHVVVEGDTIVVAAYQHDNASQLMENSGAVYVFKRVGAMWQQTEKLIGSDTQAQDFFGSSLAIHGDTLLVGAFRHDHGLLEAGAAYVFRFNGATWVEDDELLASDRTSSSFLGCSAALDGDMAVVGAFGDADNCPGPPGCSVGGAYVFVYVPDPAPGTWQQVAKLGPAPGHEAAFFGQSVAIKSDTILVGAYLDDGAGNDTGLAYVFRLGSGSGWTQRLVLAASDGNPSDLLGASVAIDGARGLVGARFAAAPALATNVPDVGAVYVFDLLNSPDCNCNAVADSCDIADCAGDAACDDCNGNSIPDECDIANCPGDPACSDCNGNGVPDGCDIASGASQDCNGDGVPDECDPLYCSVAADCGDSACAVEICESCQCAFAVIDPCCLPAGPCPCELDTDCEIGCCNPASGTCQPAPCDDTANRYLNFWPGGWFPGAADATMAIRVRMTDLQNPVPPNAPCCPPRDFAAYEDGATCSDPADCVRWVGPPATLVEYQDLPAHGDWRGARLQCTPFYYDWRNEGAIHVTGAEVVPSSIYQLERVPSACMGMEDSCTLASPVLTMVTTRWGDVAVPFQSPTAPLTQPNALDVTALVNKFRGLAGSPPKYVAQL